jgi:hypothetical protein
MDKEEHIRYWMDTAEKIGILLILYVKQGNMYIVYFLHISIRKVIKSIMDK